MKIEEYKNEHLDQIMEIENRSFKQPYNSDIFLSYTGSPLFLVALDGNRVLGYILGTRSGVIVSIAVDPKYRRKGLGKALLDALLDRIKIPRIKLTVRVGNRGAQRFYIKMGFKPRKKIPKYYENGEDAILMSMDR